MLFQVDLVDDEELLARARDVSPHGLTSAAELGVVAFAHP